MLQAVHEHGLQRRREADQAEAPSEHAGRIEGGLGGAGDALRHGLRVLLFTTRMRQVNWRVLIQMWPRRL